MIACLLTISDQCAANNREDRALPLLRDLLEERGWTIAETAVVPDEVAAIRTKLSTLLEGAEPDLIVTTGGTGLSPRDVTPEAVRPLLEKEVPGLGERMRLRGMQSTEFAALSRSLAGSLRQSLVICLPGSPAGAWESLEAIVHLIPHAVDLIQGRTQHGDTHTL